MCESCAPSDSSEEVRGQSEAADSLGCCEASRTEPQPDRLLASTVPPETDRETE